MNRAAVISIVAGPATEIRTYSANEAILYALSIGVGAQQPTDPDELRYLRDPGLETLPTFITALPSTSIAAASFSSDGQDTGVLLHSSQSLTIHALLPSRGTVSILTKSERIILPHRELTRIHREVRMHDVEQPIATIESEVMRRPPQLAVPRQRFSAYLTRPVPTLVVDLPCAPNQALLYQLLGDCNPIHIDAPSAQAAGFPSPILHGLVSFGMVGRALIKALCADAPQRMFELSTRFTEAIFPGEALRLEIWTVWRGVASFRLVATDRRVVVHDFGRFRFAV